MPPDKWFVHPRLGLPAIVCIGDCKQRWPDAFRVGSLLLAKKGAGYFRVEQTSRIAGDGSIQKQAPAPSDVPEGFREASAGAVRPWGIAWMADGYVYRRAHGQPAACLGLSSETMVVGPGGSVICGDEHDFDRCAGAGRQLRPISPLVVDGWGLRFDAEGKYVSGTCALTGDALRVEVSTGDVVERVEDARWLAHGVIHREVEATWRLCGTRLAGPGGGIWELTTGDSVPTDHLFPLGACIASNDGWVTAHWETGVVTRVSVEGLVEWETKLPLEGEDIVEYAALTDRGVVLVTAAERAFLVGDQISTVDEVPPMPVEPEFAAAVAGIEVQDTWDGPEWRAGWTTEGWLVFEAL
jgi:hypothetical protein